MLEEERRGIRQWVSIIAGVLALPAGVLFLASDHILAGVLDLVAAALWGFDAWRLRPRP